MYDLAQIHEDHREVFKDVLAMRAYSGLSDEQIDYIYNIYVELKKIPKKDWGKKSTRNTIESINNEPN
jgi:hypothetical protein